jgi:hypothetical protein
MLLGPRVAIIVWWLAQPGRWDSAFDFWVWPVLGWLVFPWTTLMFVAVAPFGNIYGWDWIWLGVAFATDLFTLFGGGYGNRERVPGYSRY